MVDSHPGTPRQASGLQVAEGGWGLGWGIVKNEGWREDFWRKSWKRAENFVNLHDICEKCARAVWVWGVFECKKEMKRKKTARISTFGSRITSIISVALVLTIVGILAMTLDASSRVGQDIRSNIGFVVKVNRDATDVEIDCLSKQLQGAEYVSECVFTSADSILVYESRLIGERIDSLLDENPFGSEFDVKVLPDWANSDSINMIAGRLEFIPIVDEVVCQTSVVDDINSALGRFTLVLAAIAVALLAISFVLINNTVSLAVYSRRFIIHTMKLVGATGAFIRRPFLLAGLATGAVSSVIAIAMLAGARAYLGTLDAVFDQLLPWAGMWWVALLLAVAGPLICLAASAVATNRYLRADYDDMFMK